MAGLHNKVVLVTGASSGIGARSALEFAKYGCRLAITGRNQDNLEDTARRCREEGLAEANIFQMLGDVTIVEDCKMLVEDTVKHYGCLDVLCNIAGHLKTSQFHNCTPELLRDHLEGNVQSMFNMCHFGVPELYKTKGVIVNMGSLSSLRPYNTLFPYSVSKAAVSQLTKCLSLETAPKGVRCNSVEPGSVEDTRVWRRSGIAPTQEREDAHHAKARPLYPLQRIANTNDVAKVVVWLASDHASFINGVNFPVDGGMSCMSQHMM